MTSPRQIHRIYCHIQGFSKKMGGGDHSGYNSIIIPTYNRAHQLLLTLASFETQTYPKHLFEVIVADDGSTDDTKQMVAGFQASYPLIYLSHQEQRGRSAVRNLGLRHARGLYIIFCDADFLVLPEFIRIVSRYHHKYPKSVISGIPYSWDNAYTHCGKRTVPLHACPIQSME